MERTATKRIIRLLLLSYLTLFALWLGSSCNRSLPAAQVEPQDLGSSHPRHLLVRYVENDRDILLLRFVDPLDSRALAKGQSFELTPPFLKWEGVDKPVTEVGVAEWTTAEGAIINCFKQTGMSHEGLNLSRNRKKLRFHGEPFPVHGKTVLWHRLSPDRQRVIVVSSMGGPAWSVMPFVSQAPAPGPYCHQVFSLETMKEIGNPVTLANSTTEGGLEACWTQQGRHVVYWNRTATTIWVVKADGS